MGEKKYSQPHDRQKAWKQKTNFERSEARRQYKADWIRQKRQNVDTTNLTVVSTFFEAGDEVAIDLILHGNRCRVRGRVIPGSTQSQACVYPKGNRAKSYLLRVPFDPDGTKTVEWHHNDLSGVISLPIAKIIKL